MKLPPGDKLLTRDEFRESVFARDNHKCVICAAPAVDSHHVLERRLWKDGGYYLDNGASVCEECHIKAETTEISCDTLREACGITKIILPEHLYKDQKYDKWSNIILPTGQRIKGELFFDTSVQKILAEGNVLHLFSDHIKYPRTFHLPWSPGMNDDDRMMTLEQIANLSEEEIIVTIKCDGENTSLYSDGMHARSLDYSPHPSRDRAKAIHASIAAEIPKGWRICAENVTAVHSIEYQDLPGHLIIFSIWNENNQCLSWDETKIWAELFGLPTVPEILRTKGVHQKELEDAFALHKKEHEGYVIRVARQFGYAEFRNCVGKYVREHHVTSSHNWMNQVVRYNGVKKS